MTAALKARAAAADPRHLEELRERGYTIFERAYSTDEVDYFRNHLVSTWEALGSPKLDANPPYRPSPDVEIGPAGVVFHRLTSHYPDLAARLYKPEIIAVLRGLLGDDMHLELPAGALSDASRPFFDWHTHIDGVDDAYYQNKRVFPTFTRSQRVTHLLYLDDLTVENGRLLVYPRRITDPTPPPFNPKVQRWEGAVEVDCPRGSVVVIEQCTWHAAHPKRSPGLRGFIGSYFASHDTPTTPWADEALRTWQGDDELFRSLLPRS